jgi:hypothetical protein
MCAFVHDRLAQAGRRGLTLSAYRSPSFALSYGGFEGSCGVREEPSSAALTSSAGDRCVVLDPDSEALHGPSVVRERRCVHDV